MFKTEADLHTHTVASGHAYATVNEMAQAAARKGIKLIAMTDHGPQMPGGAHRYHFGNISDIPETIAGVRVLKGIEANILENGNLDLSQSSLSSLEFVAAGLHGSTGHDLSNKKEFTEATIAVMDNPYLDMITHPIQTSYPLEIEKVVKAAAKKNIILELNASSYRIRNDKTRGDKAQSLKLLKLANKYNCLLAVNSDAHFYTNIGDYSNLDFIFESEYFNSDLIINKTVERVKKYLEKNK